MSPLVTLVAQRHEMDCGVACLAMFLGVSYEDALLALGGEVPRVLRRGVYFTELRRAAEALGACMALKRKWNWTDEGLLHIKLYKRGEHLVVLRRGLIFETDLSVWQPQDYLKAKKARAGGLLMLCAGGA